MAITPPPDITPAPMPPPQRGDKLTFANRVDAFITWMTAAVFQFNLLSQWIVAIAGDIYNAALAAAASALQAQTAAANSIAAVDLVATSSTSLPLAGPANRTATIQANKGFVKGMGIRFAVTASPGVRIDGIVNDYNSATGQIDFKVESTNGTGTYAAWTVSVSLGSIAFNSSGFASRSPGQTVDLQLHSASNTYQQLSAGSGVSVIMEDETFFVPQFNLFKINNFPDDTFSNYVGLKDYAGNLLGFLPPGRTTDVDLGTDFKWVFPEASPVGRPIRAQMSTAYPLIGASNLAYVRTVQLDANRTLIILHGVSMHAIIYNQATNQFGAMTALRTAWGGTGSYDNVMASLIGPDSVLVVSCPENSTVAQVIAIDTSGSSGMNVNPGAAQTTAFGVASARLLDIITVGTSYVIGYVTAANVARMRAHTVSGTTVSAPGTEIAGAAGTAPPALIAVAATTFALMTSTASTLTVQAYGIASGLTAITTGSAATTTVTSIVGIGIKAVMFLTARWILTCINTTAKAVTLSFAGAVPSLSAQTTVSSVVTTITGIQSQNYNASLSVAVTGTGTGGIFATDFSCVNDSGSGAPTLLSGLILPRTSPTAQTVAPCGHNADGIRTTVSFSWMIATTKETELYQGFDTGFVFTINRSYWMGPLSVSTALPVPAIYPKQSLHKSVLSKFNSLTFSTLGDGSKSALYSSGAHDLGTMRNTPPVVTDPVNGDRGADQTTLWLCYCTASSFLTLEQVRLA